MIVENQNILDKKTNSEQSQIDVKALKESLHTWGEKTEITEETKREAEEIIQELVSAHLPAADMEAILSKLPLAKRFIIEKMILDEQRHQFTTISKEQYRQYLELQFPSGVPTNVWETALNLLSDTSEMYKTVQQEIMRTGLTSSEHEKQIRQKEQRMAIAATQDSEASVAQLTYNLSHIA